VRLTVSGRRGCVVAAAKEQNGRRRVYHSAVKLTLTCKRERSSNERDRACLTCEIIACINFGGVDFNLFEILCSLVYGKPLYAKLCTILDCSPVRARLRTYNKKQHLPHLQLQGTQHTEMQLRTSQ
jgi:hypothetical protein